MKRNEEQKEGAHRLVYVGRSSMEILRGYRSRLRRLRDEGFEVHIFAGDDGGRSELEAEGLVFRPLPVKNPRNPAGLLGAYLILQGAFLEKPPLLVHVFSHRLAWLTAFAAREAKVSAMFATMEYHWIDEPPIHLPKARRLPGEWRERLDYAQSLLNRVAGPGFRKTMEDRYRWLGNAVDRYLVVTEFDYRLAQDLELVKGEKLELIPGGAGVDGSQSGDGESSLEREAARRQLGLPREWRQVVGSMGPLTGRHGGEELLETIRSLSQRHPSMGWVIGVRGEKERGLWRELRRLERKGIVFVCEEPGLEEEGRMIAALDLLAWFGSPSTPHDPILEAIGAGAPTVGYDTPRARSLVRDGETGFLVVEGNRESLENALDAALGDPRRIREMGVRGKRHGMMRFSREEIDERVLKLYSQVLETALQVK